MTNHHNIKKIFAQLNCSRPIELEFDHKLYEICQTLLVHLLDDFIADANILPNKMHGKDANICKILKPIRFSIYRKYFLKISQ